MSIDGVDVILPSGERTRSISTDKTPSFTAFQGATSEVAAQAVETGAVVFHPWSKTSPVERRRLLLSLAKVSLLRSG